MLRWLAAGLFIALAGLQYRLWVGEGSVSQQAALQKRIEQISAENAALKARNQQLALEVAELKEGSRGIEGKARSDLGMIKSDETFYMVLPAEEQGSASQPRPSHQSDHPLSATTEAEY